MSSVRRHDTVSDHRNILIVKHLVNYLLRSWNIPNKIRVPPTSGRDRLQQFWNDAPVLCNCVPFSNHIAGACDKMATS